MPNFVQKLVTAPSFDANGVYIPEGHVGTFDSDTLTGNEEHLRDVGDFVPAMVEIAPLGPTGPNPTQPQQIPPEAVQGPGGVYQAPGRVLVGERTQPQEVRLADLDNENTAEADIAAIIGDTPTTQNDDDALVSGTVAEITADLGSKTDDELEALRAAEVDRERPRKGVLDAIKSEQAARA